MAKTSWAKRWISGGLCLAMVLSIFAGLPVFAAEGGASTSQFSGSFESGDGLSLRAEGASTGVTAQGEPAITKFEGEFTNYAETDPVKITTDQPVMNDAEWIDKLIDQNTGTKFCTTGCKTLPMDIVFSFDSAIAPKGYYISGANDDMGNQDRVLTEWKIFGSTDQSTWTELDHRTGIKWSKDEETQRFLLNTGNNSYRYYKLQILKRDHNNPTANNGTMQFSGFGLVKTVETQGESGTLNHLHATVTDGPSYNWGNKSGAWDGEKALHLEGTVTDDNAKSDIVLYDGLNIPVTENTRLSYMILPDIGANYDNQDAYDYDYTSMYAAIDLVFDDDTRLSGLDAVDQYGTKVSPQAQGDSRIMATNNWLQINTKLGQVAEGKTIKTILASYANNSAKEGKKISVYFDDVRIFDQADKNYANLADYVNILRGTYTEGNNPARGLNTPIVAVPYGFNYWAPVANSAGQSGEGHNVNAPYHYVGTKQAFQGIQISHVASNWIGTSGTYTFSADSTTTDYSNDNMQDKGRKRTSDFRHENEIAKPYYYGVTLDSGQAPGVKVEVTPTDHAAILRFTFPANATAANVVLDARADRGNAKMVYNDDGTFTTTAEDRKNGQQIMHIYGKFDKMPTAWHQGTEGGVGMFEFEQTSGRELVVELQVATSFISQAQAQQNWKEVEGKSFDQVKSDALEAWNKALGTIEVTGGSEHERVTFYSNLYRCFLYPTNMSETTADNKTVHANVYGGTTPTEGPFVYNNGFWDTFRTAWPLYSIMEPVKAGELLNGLVQHYLDNGWVPRWVAPGGSDCMVGTNSDNIFADALNRGIEFDVENAYASALRNGSVYVPTEGGSTSGRRYMEDQIFRGYVPQDANGGGNWTSSFAFSWGLEGTGTDFAIAAMAKKLRDRVADTNSAEWKKYNDEYLYFTSRSLNYVNVFNESESAGSTGWFRAKDADGNWLQTSENFNPVAMGWGYCEDNAWNYAFPYHDGRGVANLYGIARGKDGRTALGEKLDEAYSALNTADPGNWPGHKENWEGRETKQGQIHMDNQPAHHIPYMYLYTDQPWKTAYWVRDTLDRLYVGEEIGQGYFGDEDNAEASAWYVLSALGLYPLTNGNGVTALGTPLFEKAVIHRDDHTTITITADNVSRENKYVQSVSVNGKPQTKTYVDADVLARGKDATIAFTMGNTPSTTWGMDADDAPPSVTTGDSRPSPLVDLSDNAKVSAGTNAELLHDNKVTTGAAGEKAVTYTFQTPVTVEMYTITSSDAATAPTGWKLEGSNDGTAWTELDARSDESFAWNIKPMAGGDKYTRPFAITKQGSYSQYKLTFTDTKEIKVAELELLGNDKMDADRLKAEIAKIEEAHQEANYTTASWAELNTALDAAKTTANQANVTENEIRFALAQLQDAVSSLVPVKLAGEKIVAVSADEVSSGVKRESTEGATGAVSGTITNLGGITNNSQAVYKGVRFADGTSYTKMELTYAAKNSDVQNASVLVYLDKAEGTPIAQFTGINGTGSDWKDYVTKTAVLTEAPTGDHDVYLVFKAGDKSHVMNLHALRFVESAPVTGVSVTVESATIKAGETTQATAAVTPADADDTAVTWSSSDQAVATVDANGLVTGKAGGTATITATSTVDNTKSGSCTVTVIEAQGSIPVTGVTVTPATTSVQVGKTRSLTATVAPANADNKTVTWRSSDEKVATVNANGVVTGVAAGKATITATTADGNKTATCQVNVTNSETPSSSTLRAWDFVTETELPCASVSVNKTLTYGGNGAENANNLIDGSTATKLCATGGVTTPLEFVFSYETPVSPEKYFISGGNDDAGNPGRTLNTWKLYGSNSLGGNWTELDSRTGQTGWKNFEVRSFALENANYQYYKLKIENFNADNPGTIQFSGFGLLKAVEGGGQLVGTEDGKTGSVTMSVEPKDGKLHVSGHHSGGQSASIGKVLYDSLNIPVTEKTRLVYNITPQQPLANNQYDYDFYSMHLAVDLKFTDGTYLSELGLEDENRVLADPNSQGEGKAMLYAQENQITIPLGTLKGKTIESVLIRYANDAGLKSAGSDYKADLDYIKLVEAEPLNYGKDSLVDYAYILRGTNNFGGAYFSRGLTGPMVAVPHGFNFWAPETSTGNTMFDYRAGYINGFRCSHEPSIWVGDRSVWRFMPGVGNASGICTYSHDNVIARPYYFSVQFDEKAASPANGIQVELSPTDHGMITRLSYPNGAGDAYLDIKDLSGLTFDTDSKSFQGYKDADSNQMPKMFVYGTFDQPFTVSGSRVTFTGGRIVQMRAATSFISEAQAQKNLEQELSGDFDTVKAAAKKLWNDKLSRIEIEGATEEQRIAFYSNLYRLFLYPNNMGEYTGQGDADGWQYMSPYTKQVEDGKLYYNNGFWDTYRTTWAAYSLLTPAQNNEMLAGLIRHYQDSNWMPRWIAPAGTNSMVGTSSDVIFGDAMMRGAQLTAEQWQLAYQSALKNASMSTFEGANGGRDGIDKGLFLGYTPGGSQKFSWSIEGYINDYGIANLAQKLGDQDAYVYYLSRATNYVNLFRDDGEGVENKWLAAKNEDGTWTRSKIDVFAFHDDYTETTPLNMAFSVPQDGQGLANLYGGRAALAEKLDTLFETTLDIDCVGANHGIHERKEAQEVKMGEYGHSNQPSHHIPYMYLYAGQPHKTQEKVRQVLRQCYVGSRIGQGYIGDEDNGEMSAWYVLSAMGIYPLNMGSGEFAFGSPLFTKVTIHHENGHDLVFSAPENSRENIYVNGVTINGKPYSKTSILQTELTDALKTGDVTVEYAMQSTPGTWGTGEDDAPTSITTGTEAPDPLKDRLETGATALTALPEGNVSAASIYSPNVQSGVALNQLLDNNSKTSVAFNPTGGKVEIYYFSAASMPVELYTITDAGDKTTAPAKFQLYGSNDNEDWTALDSRENVVYDWGTFTKPFLTDDANARYRSFKLVIETDSKVEIAELELMSRTASMMNAGALEEQIAAAKALQGTLEQQALKNLLGDAIQAAQAVADKGDSASAAEIAQAVEDLQTAMTDIPALSRMWKLLENVKALTGFDQVYQAKVAKAIEDATALSGDAAASAEQLRQMITRLETVLEMVKHTPRDGFAKIEAEHFDSKHSDIVNDGDNIGGVKPGTWVKYSSVNFSGKAGLVQIRYAAQERDAGGTIQVRLDALDGPVIAELEAPVTGSNWNNYVTIKGILKEYVEGVYDVYLCFSGSKSYVANVDWFQFAKAERIYYPITILPTEHGTIETDCKKAAVGDIVQVTVKPDEGYRLVEGSLKYNGVQMTNNSFVMPAEPVTITAEFEKIPDDMVPVTGVKLNQKSAELAVGETLTLIPTVEPTDATNKNVSWTSSDTEVATVKNGVVTAVKAGEAIITVTTEDGAKRATCTVTVKEKDDGGNTGGGTVTTNYTITVNQTNGGKISPSTVSVTKGSDKTFTITANEGYKIADVLVDGKSVGAVGTYTFKNVTAKHTITAKFEKADDVNNVGGFIDVKSTDWFAEAVQYAVDEGLMNGTSADTFTPNGATTRGMIVTILYRQAGSPEVESDKATWWSDARVWAMANGVSDGTNMDKEITREQLATMLYRYAELTGEDISKTTSLDGFKDGGEVSSYAVDALKWAAAEGIVTGKTGGIIDPQAGATRAETAAMFMRFCELNN